jgi:hypothetical protein
MSAAYNDEALTTPMVKSSTSSSSSFGLLEALRGSSSHTKAVFSGGVAGMVANSMLHPFDTVSLRMKVQTETGTKAAGFFYTVKTMFRQGM